MKKNKKLVGPLLQLFFVDYLCSQRRASPETVSSYRDTWRLLLQYINDTHGVPPVSLTLDDLNASVILSFLDHLESGRKNSIKSRNVRLAAIRTFFRLVALNEPACVHQATSIIAIPTKRTSKRLIHFLSKEEINALIAAPDVVHLSGRRDHALLLTLYNSGARASEILSLRKSQIAFGSCNFLCLHGKGRKERTIPLWTNTASILQNWLKDAAHFQSDLVFMNANGQKLTRNGLNYILQGAVKRASQSCPSLRAKSVTPHVLRHTTATHLLQSGVDISVIALCESRHFFGQNLR